MMKNIKYITSLMLVGLLVLSSCNDSFFDINKDPNNPEEATLALTLPSTMSHSAFVFGGYYQTLGGFWTQQYAQGPAASQWAMLESYNLNDGDFSRQYTTLYADALTDCKQVREQATKENDWGYYMIATIMQSYIYQVLVDLHGDVPYSEALQGVANLRPHYDKAEDVYTGILADLNEGVAKYNELGSLTNPKEQDLIFNGDYDKWIQFANTLKLKIYLRYVNKDAAKYAAEIKALLAANNFLAEDARVSAFKNEIGGYNPFYGLHFYRLTGNVVASKTLFDRIEADSRMAFFYKGGSLAMLQGSYITVTGSYSDYAQPNITSTYPVYYFTKEETLFLIAEAQLRYGTEMLAKESFQKAIAASFSRAGQTYDGSVVYNGIKSIIEQKWIASTNMRSLEAFFDYNRTGYPDFFVRSAASSLAGDTRPVRLLYPENERKTNPNTPKGVTLTDKIWWNK